MIPRFNSYFWKEGKPYGKDPDEKGPFRIVVDPYYKRFSVELYEGSEFKKILYDSNLFDFRALKDPRQASWIKIALSPTESLLKNQEDRVVLKETYTFEQNRPRACLYSTPQGIPVAHHRISYTDLGDPFDGVTLYDIHDVPVMRKKYALNNGEFGELLEESWAMNETTEGASHP